MVMGEHPMGDPMMDPQAAMAALPKPRRKIWREELLVDEVFLAYKDRTELLPDPDLIERIFLLVRRRDRHLVVRLGDRSQPWQLPVLEFEIEPRPETGPEDADQEERRERLDEMIRSVVHETWQVPISAWEIHTRVQMTAKHNQLQYQAGARRYEIVVTAECGDPDDLAPGTEWARALLPAARDEPGAAPALHGPRGAGSGARAAGDRSGQIRLRPPRAATVRRGARLGSGHDARNRG